MSFLLRVALASLTAVSAAAPSLAQTCTTEWASPVSGDWEDAANWTDGLPGADDTACITAPGTYTVTSDRGDRALAALTLGGASGTQTLTTQSRLTVSGEVRVGVNGRWEFQNRTPGNGEGLVFADGAGTLTVEGTVVTTSGVSLLNTGGTLHVAPGGTLRLTDGASVGDDVGVLRVNGLVEADCDGGNCQVHAPIEVDGGTIRTVAGRLEIREGGTLRDLKLDAAAGTTTYLSDPADAQYLIEGTLSGDLAGDVLWNGALLAAGPAGATLDVEGTGVQLVGSSLLISGGGSFTNTGLLVRPSAVSNFSGIRGVEVLNRGTVEVRSGLSLQEGAVIRNAPDGVISFTAPNARLSGEGEVISRGLIVVEAGATGRPALQVPVDLRDSEVRVGPGPERLDLPGGGALDNVTFSVAAGVGLWLRGTYDVSGTLSGTPEGDLVLLGGTTLRATSDVTFDVGGTGLVSSAGSGQAVILTSAGGAFANAGRFRALRNGLWVRQAIFRNLGAFENRTTVRIEEGAVVRNEATFELVDSGGIRSGDDTGRFVNAALVIVRSEDGASSSTFRGTLRTQPGSEIRALGRATVSLDPPGSATLPDGARVTGDGRLVLSSRDLALEGTLSPGTDAQPVDTLRVYGWLAFSRTARRSRFVVDVGPGGASDLVETQRGPGPAGSVRLAGALVVRVADGYTPQPGDTFTILRTTNATDDIQDDFDVVVAEGAPATIAFVAERNANNTEILVRAVEAGGGPLAVTPLDPVGGGERSLFVSGPGAAAVTAARFVCDVCLDADAFGALDAEVAADGALREVRVDLTDPRVYGFYDLVLEREGMADTTVAVTVRPFLSFIAMTPGVNRGIGVRPSGLRYNWSALRVTNVSNADAPAYTVAALEREDMDQVALALANTNAFGRNARVFEESLPENGPTQPILAFGRFAPGQQLSLNYGQRVLPTDVLFPEQTPTGPDDDRIPFGDKRIVVGLAAQHASFARMQRLVADALRDAEDDVHSAYLATAEAADPGSVGRAVGAAIDTRSSYVEGLDALFERIVDQLDESAPAPAGLAASAAPAFADALDRQTTGFLVDSYEANNRDLEDAPAPVLALVNDELDALGIGPASQPRVATRGASQVNVAGKFCKVTKSVDRALREADRKRKIAALMEGLRRQREQQERAQKMRDVTQGLTESLSKCKGVPGGSAPSSQQRRAPAGSCTPPPAPPGGPGAGGGGACGPPSAPADPNDKTANLAFPCEMGTVTVDGQEVPRCTRYFVPRASAAEPIPYSVQFENLPQATANAETVTITDELDPSLDPATLEVLATSSDSTFSYSVSGQTATFRFVGIDLPPNVEQPEGQGFVTFAVRPRANLEDGTVIRNDAEIVFDFNPPIATPEVVHEIRETSDLAVTVLSPDFDYPDQTLDVEVFVANLQGDPAGAVTLTVALPAAPTSVSAPDGKCTGTTTLTCTLNGLGEGEVARVAVQLPPTPLGDYTITAEATGATFDGFLPNNRQQVGLPIVGVDAEDGPGGRLTLTAGPNPTRGALTLRWTLPAVADVELRVFDLLGREVAHLEAAEAAPAGDHAAVWDADVAAGVYVVRLQAGDEVRTRRVTVLR